MKTWIFGLLLLLASVAAFGQGDISYPATDPTGVSCVGKTYFASYHGFLFYCQGGVYVKATPQNLPSSGVTVATVATLPAGQPKGTPAVVTDAASSTDCTVGGGSTIVLCRYDGSAWGTFPAGSASAGGLSGQGQYNNAGALAGWTASGDCTITFTTGAITCTKTNGTLITALTWPFSQITSTPTTLAGYGITNAIASGATAGGDLSGTLPNPTVAKINGVSVPASPTTHQLLVITALGTSTYKTLPDCQDTGGNHYNYTQSTDTFSCGTSSSGGGGAAGGTVTYTTNQTASTSDNSKLVVMNCTTACTYTLPNPQPSTTFYTKLVSVGTTVATVSLGTSITYNGGSTAPTLSSSNVLQISADSATATNYAGDTNTIRETIVGTPNTGVGSSTTQYFSFAGGSAGASGTPRYRTVTLPFSGTMSNFCVRTQNIQSGTGALTLNFYDQTASVATSLVVTIPANGADNTQYCDNTDVVAVTGGHDFEIQGVNAATVGSTTVTGSSLVYTHVR